MNIEISAPVALSTSQVLATPAARLPLRGWALELARRWNGGTYSLFVVHGNIFDLFPVQEDSTLSYVPLEDFPGPPAFSRALLPALFRHRRRAELWLGRYAEAVFRVARGL